MTGYIVRRLVLMVPVAWLVTVVVFVLLRLAPGDPTVFGEERDPAASEALRRLHGLDQPLPVQYVAWLGRVVRGDLGRSIRTNEPVSKAIVDRLPATLELGGAAVLLSISVALVVGTLSAVKRNSALDLVTTGFTLAGVSLPSFVLGLILILVFALVLRWLPPGGFVPFTDDPLGNLRRLILPAITLATASLAVNVRQVRSSILEVLTQDYIRTARAKGLAGRVVILRHALKGGLFPVVTLLGLQIGAIIEGAVITETVFSWPGIGRLLVESIAGRDYPVVQGVVLISALSFMVSTLLVDLLYVWLDPRVSFDRSRA